MNEVLFGWIGETRRTAVVSLIKEEVLSWSADWWLHHHAADVEVSAVPSANGSNPFLSRILRTGSGSLALNFSGKDVDGLGRYLCGTADSEDAGWAQRLGAEALEKLCFQVFERAHIRGESTFSEAKLSLGFEDDRMGALCLRITLGRISWLLYLDRALVDRLVSSKEEKVDLIETRKQALESAAVRVTANIDFGPMDATDLVGLQVGEILVSDRALHEPIELHIDGHGTVASGYMRSKSDQYAFVLDKAHI